MWTENCPDRKAFDTRSCMVMLQLILGPTAADKLYLLTGKVTKILLTMQLMGQVMAFGTSYGYASSNKSKFHSARALRLGT